MAIEEKVIQNESVTNSEQPVAETNSQPKQPETTPDTVKLQYEEQIKALKKELAAKEEDRLGVKRKLNEVYKEKDEQRKQELEDQGQWKTLWKKLIKQHKRKNRK